MMKLKYFFLILGSIFIITACGAGKAEKHNDSGGSDSAVENQIIELPAIPSNLTDPDERADYLIIHFWDKADFTDEKLSHDRAKMEQSLVDFYGILPLASSDSVASRGFEILLNKSFADEYALKVVTETTEDYLANPNSPMLSEDLYIIYLKAVLNTDKISDAQRARLEDRLEMVSKNRTGTRATDFSFEMPDGKYSTLFSSLPENGDLMLIFFDPECETCEEILGKIKSDNQIAASIEEGTLSVLAVYSGDNMTAWRRKAATLPENWTVGINESQIEDEELYYLPAMPTIYILDNEGVVRGKDVQIGQ